ncbi:MAG: RNA polymerase sigma-70 factor [Phaeodactylibacter sp.]|nr:RNA polymerase sigma-70 factor [Phaeodactylibacter sp.]
MKEEERPIYGLSPAAFEALFRQHYEELYYYACRYLWRQEDAEEAVQDVFVRLWEKRRELHISTSAKAYLYAAVRNRAINHLRSKWAREAPLPPEAAEQLAAEPPGQEPGQEDLLRLVQQGIAALPEQCRVIFQLSRQAGLTYGEIAEELGISKETVKSQIKIALSRLRAFLGERLEVVFWLWWWW